MQGVVGEKRAIALGDLFALDSEELLPELLGLPLLSLDPLPIALGRFDRACVELSPFGSLDRRLFLDGSEGERLQLETGDGGTAAPDGRPAPDGRGHDS